MKDKPDKEAAAIRLLQEKAGFYRRTGGIIKASLGP